MSFHIIGDKFLFILQNIQTNFYRPILNILYIGKPK